MNKEKKKRGKESVHGGGGSLPNMQLLTEVIQRSKYCPYCFYYRCICLLLLTFTHSFCSGASEFIFASEAPELSRHATGNAPCWRFVRCERQLQSWDRSCNISVILSILALYSLCQQLHYCLLGSARCRSLFTLVLPCTYCCAHLIYAVFMF